jgi:S-adenosylmethionine hydrolase
VDRFGNLITNLPLPDPTALRAITLAGRHIEGLSRTFADVEPGELVAYAGSGGHLEIAVREGNAAQTLGLGVGDAIQIEAGP